MKININNLEEAGAVIRMARKQQGFTQEEYAMQLGFSHFLARDIEKGKPTVKMGNFMRYIEELGIELVLDFPQSGNETKSAANEKD